MALNQFETAYSVLMESSGNNQTARELLDLLYHIPGAENFRDKFEQPEFPFKFENVSIQKVIEKKLEGKIFHPHIER